MEVREVMIFKRTEGFRFAFEEPLDAGFVILIDGKPADLEQNRVACQIIDISPRGMKLATDTDLNEYSSQMMQLEIHFVLDQVDIKGIGEIVWSKMFGNGYHYGIVFYNQPAVEATIVNELKSRRRKEVKKKRPNEN